MAKKHEQPDAPFMKNGIRPGVFYYGDNLEGMQKLPDECIDLIYLDPPFNSKKQWSGVVEWRDKMTTVAFKDAWSLNQIKQTWFDLIQSKEEYQPLREVAEAVRATAGVNAYAYILYMAIRLIEMKRILKGAGSIYYHCDPVMSHSVKLMMDSIFGLENFRNEIVWKRTNSPKSQTKTWGVQRDCLLFYTKTDEFVFNKVHKPYSPEQLRAFRYDDNDGRGAYQTIALIAGSSQKPPNRKTFDFRGVKGAWLYKKETLDKWWKEGRIHKTPTGYRLKDYLKDREGAPISDIWADSLVAPIQTTERLGYPTQKPEALLERIILASTNEGDVVLDPFAGSGTTCAIAEILNRRRIGMDLNREAADISTKRLRKLIKSLSKEEQKNRQSLFFRGDKNAFGVRRQTAAESVERAKGLQNILNKDEIEVSNAHRRKLKEDALQVQHGRCLGCGRWSLDGANFDCEHIYPKSQGGLLTKNNTQALCGNCNSVKQSGTMRDLWKRLDAKSSRPVWTGDFWRLVLRVGEKKNYTKGDLADADKRRAKADKNG